MVVQLSRKAINMRELRKIAALGIPDAAGIRSTVWKVMASLKFFLFNFDLTMCQNFLKLA